MGGRVAGCAPRVQHAEKVIVGAGKPDEFSRFCIKTPRKFPEPQAGSSTLERVMNSIRNGLGMRKTEIARTTSRPRNPHVYAIFAQVHNTL